MTCGDGTKSRSRSCNNPAPFGGGTECSGDSTQSASCNNGACPGIEDISQPICNSIKVMNTLKG